MGIYLDTFTKHIKPEQQLTVTEWSDAERYLPASTSAESGKYRSSRVPFWQELMDKMSSHERETDTIIVMKGAQLGYSEVLNNIVGYVVDHAPSPLLYLFPTIDLARRASRQRLEPLFNDNPKLKNKLPKPKSGQGTNTTLERSFNGGNLLMAGSNSTNQLRQYSARYLLCDETDGFTESTVEGNPIDLAIARTGGFSTRRKILLGSTPTVEGESHIEREFEQTDQRYYFIPCPHCNHMQTLKWGQMQWKDDDPETVYYECEQCQGKVYEKYKQQMLSKGEWRPTRTSKRKGLVGYHINALYSPFKPWSMLVQEFLTAKRGGQDKLQVVVNTVFAETWKRNDTTVDADPLLARREMPWTKVPKDCLFLTAGVDVQQNRLECNVVGFGKGNEAWFVDYFVIYGDPNQPMVWSELDTLLMTTYEHESGNVMKIGGAGIDTGYATDRVYEYINSRSFIRLFAIKGIAGWNRPLVSTPTKQTIRKGVTIDLFSVAVDMVKSQIYSMLRVKETGPGYVHIPLKDPFNEKWIRGLTAEQLRTIYINGKQKKVWRLKTEGLSNEPLDTTGYAFAVLQLLNINWSAFESHYSGKAPEAQERKQKKKRRIVTKSGW